MEINIEDYNIEPKIFINYIYSNALSNFEKTLKLNYIYNKKNYTENDKYNLKKVIKTLKGGYRNNGRLDIHSYVLSQMYDVVNEDSKSKIKDHFKNKIIKEQTGGGEDLTELMSKLTTLLKSIDDSKQITTEDQTKIAIKDMQAFNEEQQKIALGNSKINGTIFTGPLVSNILTILKDLKSMSPDDIHKLTNEQTISNLFMHLGNLSNIKTHNGEDIKNIVDFLKSHSIFSTMYLNNVVSEISKAGSNTKIFSELNASLNTQQNNIINIIEKIGMIDSSLKKVTQELKVEESYDVYPLDVKIVSNEYLDEKYKGGKKEYYIDTDAIKIQFKNMPSSIKTIMDSLKKRTELANKKVPGIGNNILTTVKDISTFNQLINDFKKNQDELFYSASGGAGTDLFADNTPTDLLNLVDSKHKLSAEFSTMNTSRKETSSRIKVVSGLINEMDSKINDLVNTIKEFNVEESREHYFSYVMANLALNANVNKKYKYMSFGVLDFYKSIIDTIYEKINIRNGEEKLKGADTKFLFFYHYHFKIIKKLKLFLDKFYKLKNLNIFYLKNTFIEIAECTGKVKEYLSLLNIYKYLLDDFYAKIGIGKSSSNVSVYLRINDFSREKLLLGRQFGTVYGNSNIPDQGYGEKGAFMYNVDLLNINNIGNIIDGKDIKEIAKSITGKFDDQLENIWKLILNKDNMDAKFKWQQYAGTKYTKLNEIDSSNAYRKSNNLDDEDNLYAVKKDDYGKKLFTDSNEAKDTLKPYKSVNDLKKEIYYTYTKKNPTLADLYKERERKRFFIVNRAVPSILKENYTMENISENTNYSELVFIGNPELNPDNSDKFKDFILPNNKKDRPLIAKIAFLPLLDIIEESSLKKLGLKEIKDKVTTVNKEIYGNCIFKIKATIGKDKDKDKQEINELIDFTDINTRVKMYIDLFNGNKIFIPLLPGFIPKNPKKEDSTDEDNGVNRYDLGLKYDENGNNTKGIFDKYRNIFNGLNVSSFQIKTSDDNNYLDQYTIDTTINIVPNLDPIIRYHYYIKQLFNTLFYEQIETYRDDSEMIFSADQSDKKLVVNDIEKCQRLLDRYTNEDDYLLIDKLKTEGHKKIETKFNHVFSTEKNPDNESIAMFMSIPSKLSLGNGFMLLTFGYSGTGKTYTVFGDKAQGRGILQTTLDEVEKDGDVYFRCYEVYGIGLPYASYWYDKLGISYDPKRVELLIHHKFKANSDELEHEGVHVFDTPDLRKKYLNNVNWFFPDAGEGNYKKTKDPTTGIEKTDYPYEYQSTDIPPASLDKCTYIGDDKSRYVEGATSSIGYIRYDNDLSKQYIEPRSYSSYENNELLDQSVSPSVMTNNESKSKKFSDMKKKYIDLDPSDSFKNNSTYVKISDSQITDFSSLISIIDNNRKQELKPKFYNNNTLGESPPDNYKFIKRIKPTSNNPESSRSIIYYEFVIKLKEPQLVTIEDAIGRKINVWRYYVTLLIVDLPGQEDIKTSFVEKNEFNISSNTAGDKLHEPVFKDTQNINNRVLYTYKDGKKKDPETTNSDPEVYKYNELLQKLIKSSVYMNPLFKFMSKISLDKQLGISKKDIDENFIMGGNWFITKVEKKPVLILPNINSYLDYNIKDYKERCKKAYEKLLKSIASEQQENNPYGSTEYKQNITYILDGLYILQKNPLNYIIDYVLDDVTPSKKSNALAPFEGYMINENVGSLITYLFNKTKEKNDRTIIHNIKEQQKNFAIDIINEKLIPADMSSTIPNPKEADNNTIASEFKCSIIDSDFAIKSKEYLGFKMQEKPMDIINDWINGINPGSNKPKTVYTFFNNSLYNKPTEINVDYKDSSITGEKNEKKVSEYCNKILDQSRYPLRYSEDTNYGFRLYRPNPYLKDSKGNKLPTVYYVPDIDDMWTTFWNHYIKYIMLIDIFLITRKLRGCDKYFRQNVMRHTNSSNNNKGKIMPSKAEFQSNLTRLERFYDFYINDIITNKSSTMFKGIYDKNKLFRNGEVNKYLDTLNAHFYKKKNGDNDNYYVSSDAELEKKEPEYYLLNKKPLIFNYLEPYEPFFNSYSLLYVMSNNDPHIKCYKQIELLRENEKFLKEVTKN
jgi:hypothetical protein